MGLRPFHHRPEDARKVLATVRQVIFVALRTRDVGDFDDHAALLQAAQAVTQEIGRNPFRRARELTESPLAEEQEIADDEERPPVPEQIESLRDRAVGALRWLARCHGGQGTPDDLQPESDCARVRSLAKGKSLELNKEDRPMPTPQQKMAAELEREAVATRRILERVPADRLDWQPHPKSMTLGQLALHMANIPGGISRMARLDGMDVAGRPNLPPQPQSADELLAALDASLTEARSLLETLDDEAADAPWRLSAGPREIFTLPRIDILRTMMLNHLYHHRGQLAVYLRLLDIPVPVIYGRSADENPFMDA